MDGKERDIFDFMVAAGVDAKLREGFMDAPDAKMLQAFFEHNHYSVSLEDCKKLITARKEMCPTVEEGFRMKPGTRY